MKKTKFYAFIMLVFSVFALSSCGSDDKDDDKDLPSGTDVKSLIVGDWRTDIGDGSDVTYFTFDADGYCEIMSVYIDDNLNTEIETAEGYYKINGKNLSIKVRWNGESNYEEEGGVIESISETRLVIKDSYGDRTMLTRIE